MQNKRNLYSHVPMLVQNKMASQLLRQTLQGPLNIRNCPPSSKGYWTRLALFLRLNHPITRPLASTSTNINWVGPTLLRICVQNTPTRAQTTSPTPRHIVQGRHWKMVSQPSLVPSKGSARPMDPTKHRRSPTQRIQENTKATSNSRSTGESNLRTPRQCQLPRST